jgi:hypothetical protein
MAKQKRLGIFEFLDDVGLLKLPQPLPNLESVLALRDKPSGRKLRLFACACCRRVWPRLSDECKSFVEIAERHADGLASSEELATARSAARTRVPAWVYDSALDPPAEFLMSMGITAALSADSFDSALNAARLLGEAGSYKHGQLLFGTYFRVSRKMRKAEADAQAALIEEMFGSVKSTIDRNWCSADVVGIAQSIYDERAFDRLPILADALEDAGCDNADILNHCRSGGEHVRGCWVVDLVLGKE